MEQDFMEEQFIDHLPVVSDGLIYAHLFIYLAMLWIESLCTCQKSALTPKPKRFTPKPTCPALIMIYIK